MTALKLRPIVSPKSTITLTLRISYRRGPKGVEELLGDVGEDSPFERCVKGETEPGEMWDKLRVFEDRLIGKVEGDEFDITLKPSEAYGETNFKKIHTLTGERFEEFLDENGLDPDGWQYLEIGDKFSFDAESIIGRISEATEERIVLDSNHDLAGCSIRLVGKILSVR